MKNRKELTNDKKLLEKLLKKSPKTDERKVYFEKLVLRNIDIIFNNETVEKEARKFRERNPKIVDYIKGVLGEDIEFSTIPHTFQDENGKYHSITIETHFNLKDLISHISITELRDIPRAFHKSLNDLSLSIQRLTSPANRIKIQQLCKSFRYNPKLWEDIILARIIGIPQGQLSSHFLEPIIEKCLMPKVKIRNNKVTIEINEYTSIEDVKKIWTNKVKPLQKKAEGANNYKSHKRVLRNQQRDELARNLQESGLTYPQIQKELKQRGYKMEEWSNLSHSLKKAKEIKK